MTTPTPDSSHDGAAVRVPPPLVYLAAVILGGVLHVFVVPLHLPLGGVARAVLAIAAAALGLLLGASALNLFRGIGQDPKPWVTTPAIVSHGVFRFTRNPMYVGMALLQTGIGVAWANGWILVLLPVVLAIVYATAIRHEEAYLERKFGSTYTDYKRSVRRWL